MSTPVNKKQYYQTIDRTCYLANITYTILFVFYLILFIIAKLNILVFVDIATIVIYLLFFVLIKKKKYFAYALTCGNAFFIFISVTTIMLGFNSGFHFYLIALSVVSFFSTYFSRNRNIRDSVAWCVLSLIIYLTLYFITEFVKPYYMMERWLEIALSTTHIIIVFVLISAYMVIILKYAISLENKITNESRMDELTQINNRYSLYDYYDQVEDKSSLVLAIFDIDDFKNINDSYGHVTGDYILKEVARLATSTLSDTFICRYGGEEFVIVMKDEGENDVFNKLEKLRKQIEKENFVFEKYHVNITITLGAANYTNGQSLEKWIEAADKKMYQGKNTGKNQTII